MIRTIRDPEASRSRGEGRQAFGPPYMMRGRRKIGSSGAARDGLRVAPVEDAVLDGEPIQPRVEVRIPPDFGRAFQRWS